MSDLRTFLGGDRFAAAVGIELVDVAEGRARARLVVEERHLNGAGVVQGGAIFTLADFAFAAACNSRGVLALAAAVDIRFVKAVRAGVLVADAVEEAVSRRLSTCAIRVTDEAGDLVALFTGTAFRKGDPVPRP